MIIKVKFKQSDGGEYVMMFGDSYKRWQTQYEEFRRLYPKDEVIQRWISHSKWKGWGGLKWCSEENFQKELNREGCQDNEPDNPKPRQYSRMKFKSY